MASVHDFLEKKLTDAAAYVLAHGVDFGGYRTITD